MEWAAKWGISEAKPRKHFQEEQMSHSCEVVWQPATSHVLALGQFYFILNKALWAESMSALLMLYTQRWAQHLA